MAGEYAAMANDLQSLSGLDREQLVAITEDQWAAAKQELQIRLRRSTDALRRSLYVTETAFYDGIAALGSGDLYDELRVLVALEALVLRHEETEKAVGRGVQSERRLERHNARLARRAAAFAGKVEEYVADRTLTYTTNRTSDKPSAQLWVT